MLQLSSIEDRILLMMIDEKEPLYIGEISIVLGLHRFFVRHALENLIRKKIVSLQLIPKKDDNGDSYGMYKIL